MRVLDLTELTHRPYERGLKRRTRCFRIAARVRTSRRCCQQMLIKLRVPTGIIKSQRRIFTRLSSTTLNKALRQSLPTHPLHGDHLRHTYLRVPLCVKQASELKKTRRMPYQKQKTSSTKEPLTKIWRSYSRRQTDYWTSFD